MGLGGYTELFTGSLTPHPPFIQAFPLGAMTRGYNGRLGHPFDSRSFRGVP